MYRQTKDGAAEKKHCRREGNILPDRDGKDGMVGNQRIESRNQQQYERSDFVGAQRGDKVGHAARKQAHLEKGIDGYGDYHIFCQRVADLVEEAEQQRVNPGMMIGPGNHAQNLFQLVDAVGGHNPRILIEIVGKPAEQAAQKSAERRVAADEIRKRGKTGGNTRTAALVSEEHILIAGQQQEIQPFAVAGVGI